MFFFGPKKGRINSVTAAGRRAGCGRRAAGPGSTGTVACQKARAGVRSHVTESESESGESGESAVTVTSRSSGLPVARQQARLPCSNSA